MSIVRSRWRAALAFGPALVLACAAPAEAQWVVHANGPDVFGNTTVVAAAANGSGDGMVVQCDQKKLYVALISRGTSSEMDELSKLSTGIPAMLYLKVDQGPVRKFDAEMRQWNNTMLGVVATGRTLAMVAELREIGAGTQTLDVGTDVLGSRATDSFGLLGSTNAMETAVKDCKLNTNPAASGQAPKQP